MQSLTLSHPFGADARDSVGAIFWRCILRCGVLVGFGCAVMLWGLREPLAAIGSLVLVATIASGVARQYDARWTVARCALLAVRAGVLVASAAAVVEIADAAGVILVVLCLVLTPAARQAARDLAGRLLHLRHTVRRNHHRHR